MHIGKSSSLKALHLIAGVTVGVSLGALLWTKIDVSSVWFALKNVAVGPIVIALLALAADFLLRAVRFWAMLRTASGQPIPLRPCIWPFIASFGISDILPLRAGDAYRIVWFHRRLGLPLSKVVGAMAVERIFDLLAVLLLGMIAVTLVGTAIPAPLVQGVQFVIGAVSAALLVVIAAPAVMPSPDPKSANRLLRWLAALLDGCRSAAAAMGAMMRPGRGSLFAALTLICWAFEFIVFHAAWISLGGLMLDIARPLLAFSFSTLGTLLPGLPGHFGSFEFFGFKAFTLVDVDPAFGTAVLLLAHLCLWLPTALCGFIWVVAENLKPRDRNERPASS